ncbi:MAG: hypothetical protein AAGG09_22505, partial [Pseudomonadota bacterium]
MLSLGHQLVPLGFQLLLVEHAFVSNSLLPCTGSADRDPLVLSRSLLLLLLHRRRLGTDRLGACLFAARGRRRRCRQFRL